LSYEDIDLCWRIRLNGYKVVFVPKSRVYHIGGATTISSSANAFHIEKNRLSTLLKNMPIENLAKYNPLTFTLGEMVCDHHQVMRSEYANPYGRSFKNARYACYVGLNSE